MIHMYALNLSIKSQDLWISLYGLQVKMCAVVEVKFTEYGLVSDKSSPGCHWKIQWGEKKKRKKAHNPSGWQHINLSKPQHVVCLTHVYTCMFIPQPDNSTTKLLFKWLSVFEILLILEEVAHERRARQAESSMYVAVYGVVILLKVAGKSWAWRERLELAATISGPWRRKWPPTSAFLPGEFHGQRNLAGYGTWGRKESDTVEQITHLWTRSSMAVDLSECRDFKGLKANIWPYTLERQALAPRPAILWRDEVRNLFSLKGLPWWSSG